MNSPPNNKCKLTGRESAQSKCSSLLFEPQTHESDYTSPEKEPVLTDYEASESDIQSERDLHSSEMDDLHPSEMDLPSSELDVRSSEMDVPSSEMDVPSSETDVDSFERALLSPESDLLSPEKDLQTAPSLVNVSYIDVSKVGSRPYASYCQPFQFDPLLFEFDPLSSENDCFSSDNKHELVDKGNGVGVPSLDRLAFSDPQSSNLSDTQSSKDYDASSEHHSKISATSSETDFSSPLKRYDLADTLSRKSNNGPSRGKHKITEFSNNSGVKQKPLGKSILNELSFPPTESVSTDLPDIDCFPPGLRSGSDELLNVLLKSSNECEKLLRKIIRTAYHFTRHSHREKLTLEDLEKAFKIHNVDMNSGDYDDLIDKMGSTSPVSEEESQPFTCTGEWLGKNLKLDK